MESKGDTKRVEFPPADPEVVPVTIVRPEPRLFGVAPPGLVLAIAALSLLLAIFLFASGRPLVGLLVVALAAVFGALYLGLARRHQDGPVARVTVDAADHARDRAGYAWVSLSTWSRAGREVVRVRNEQRRVRSELADRVRELGEAVLRDDDDRAAELKAEARGLEDELERRERELQSELVRARERVSGERVAIQPTQALAVEDVQALGSGAVAGERPEDVREPGDADHVGLDPEREDGDEGRADPGGAR
jgi:hypothetical protein